MWQVKDDVPEGEDLARYGCAPTRYTATILVMPRTNQDGKEIALVVSWLKGRKIPDAEVAEAINTPPTTYSQGRKYADDFPSFEELKQIARHFNLSALALQVAFGYLDLNTVLLDDDGMRQYVEQGGGEAPTFPTRRGDDDPPASPVASGTGRRRRRHDAPPGP